jgi:hypothetical protein
VSVKLLFAMFDHETKDDQRTAVRDDQRTVPDDQRTSGTVRQTGRDDAAPSGTVTDDRTDGPARTGTGPADRPADPATNAPGDAGQQAPGATGDLGHRAAPLDSRTVAHLIPAARAARATLAREGRSLSRDNLADAMRDDGHGVSNERASLLLKIAKAEQDVTQIGTTAARPRPQGPDPLSEVVA